MGMTIDAKIQELLTASDLPRRLAEARKHPEIDELWRYVPEPPSLLLAAFALLLVGGCAVAPLIGLAVAPDAAPIGGTLVLIAFSALMAGLTYGTARRTLRGEVRRELYAVIDRNKRQLGNSPSFYVTLWRPETAPFRAQLLSGASECKVGDVGVAYFRGKHLVDLVKVPVQWAPA
jgi:hypothetical protein